MIASAKRRRAGSFTVVKPLTCRSLAPIRCVCRLTEPLQLTRTCRCTDRAWASPPLPQHRSRETRLSSVKTLIARIIANALSDAGAVTTGSPFESSLPNRSQIRRQTGPSSTFPPLSTLALMHSSRFQRTRRTTRSWKDPAARREQNPGKPAPQTRSDKHDPDTPLYVRSRMGLGRGNTSSITAQNLQNDTQKHQQSSMSSPLPRNFNKAKAINLQSDLLQPAILVIDEKRKSPVPLLGLSFDRS